MKMTCERERLLSAFQTVASVVPTRSPKPILQNVKLEVENEIAVLSATDLELGIRMEVSGVHVEQAGAAMLPVQRFGSILRELSDEKLSLNSDANGTVVHGDRSEFQLPGGNPEEFPGIPAFTETSYHELPARFLRELVRRTVFATDTESSRYALGGVLLELSEDRVIAVGTDGRRLAKMEGPGMAIEGHKTGEATTIIPTRSMQIIERSLSDADAEIQLAARSNDIILRSPRMTVFSRLVDGRFPKWRDVFPNTSGAVKIPMTVGPMFAAVRQAAIVASDESRGIDFTFGEGTLVMSGATAEIGSSRIELPISYDGDPITMTLDHRYVSDFLKVLDAERTFHLEVEAADRAAVFTTDDGYGYVVMPLARDR